MRSVQVEILPSGKALVDIDTLTHAVPHESGSRLYRCCGQVRSGLELDTQKSLTAILQTLVVRTAGLERSLWKRNGRFGGAN